MIIKGLCWGSDEESGSTDCLVELQLEEGNHPLYVAVYNFDTSYTAFVHRKPLYDRIMNLDTPKDLIMDYSFHKGEELLLLDNEMEYRSAIEAALDCVEIYKEGEWASADEFIEPYIDMDVDTVELRPKECVDGMKKAELMMTLEETTERIYFRLKEAYPDKRLIINITTSGTIDVEDENGEEFMSRTWNGKRWMEDWETEQ